MSSPPAPDQINPMAAVLAWVWPGLGHISMGQRTRGCWIMAGVLFLVTTGVAVGGVDCVDRKNDRLWFLAQSVCGPLVFGVDWLNQTWTKTMTDDDLKAAFAAGDPKADAFIRTVGIGRVNEMGTLFVALAGLMNLIVILDCLQGGHHRNAAPESAVRVRPAPARRASDRPDGDDADGDADLDADPDRPATAADEAAS